MLTLDHVLGRLSAEGWSSFRRPARDFTAQHRPAYAVLKKRERLIAQHRPAYAVRPKRRSSPCLFYQSLNKQGCLFYQTPEQAPDACSTKPPNKQGCVFYPE